MLPILQVLIPTVFMNYSSVFGQIDEFEQECNILKTLESLTTRLQTLDILENTKRQKLESLEAKIEQLENINKGSTYIRWGRTRCPGNGSDLIYTGLAGGSMYNHPGGAVEYICLPKDPKFAQYEDTLQDGGLVYGGEYEMHYRKTMTFFPKIDSSNDLYQKNVPCAVCRTKRTNVIMIAARNICHDGWTLEYKGYLTSNLYHHPAASQYACLDDEPEILPGGSANEDGKLFYFVEGRCGSLPCPPYTNGRELTCAICSK